MIRRILLTAILSLVALMLVQNASAASTVSQVVTARGQCGGPALTGRQLVGNWRQMGVMDDASKFYRISDMDESLTDRVAKRFRVATLAEGVRLDENRGCSNGALFEPPNPEIAHRYIPPGVQVWIDQASLVAEYPDGFSLTPREGWERKKARAKFVAQTTCSNPGEAEVVIWIWVPKPEQPKPEKAQPPVQPTAELVLKKDAYLNGKPYRGPFEFRVWIRGEFFSDETVRGHGTNTVGQFPVGTRVRACERNVPKGWRAHWLCRSGIIRPGGLSLLFINQKRDVKVPPKKRGSIEKKLEGVQKGPLDLTFVFNVRFDFTAKGKKPKTIVVRDKAADGKKTFFAIPSGVKKITPTERKAKNWTLVRVIRKGNNWVFVNKPGQPVPPKPRIRVEFEKTWQNAARQDVTAQRANERVPITATLRDAQGKQFGSVFSFNLAPGTKSSIGVPARQGWSLEACEDQQYLASKQVDPVNPSTNQVDPRFRCLRVVFSGKAATILLRYINRERPQAPPEQFRCTGIDARQTGNRTVSATVQLQPANAPVARVDWNWGDNTTTPNGGVSQSHTWGSDGDFNIVATVTFQGGRVETCSTRVSWRTPPPPSDECPPGTIRFESRCVKPDQPEATEQGPGTGVHQPPQDNTTSGVNTGPTPGAPRQEPPSNTPPAQPVTTPTDRGTPSGSPTGSGTPGGSTSDPGGTITGPGTPPPGPPSNQDDGDHSGNIPNPWG